MIRSFLSRYSALSLVLVFMLAAGCRGTPTVPPTRNSRLPFPAIQPTTLALSGAWQFSTDPSSEGETQGWAGPGFDSSSWTAVTVPQTWNAMPA